MSGSFMRSIRNLEVKRRCQNLIGPARNRYFEDDFNWDTYTSAKYGPQLTRLDREYDLRISDDVHFDHHRGRLETGDQKLHPNSKTIYEAIGILGVKSVLEVGCGGGDHIRNLKKIYPNLKIHGGDRSAKQLALLQSRNREIADQTFVQDITMPLSRDWPRAELVYSQAVIMHIKTAVSHLNALANMFSLAERYVLLMENFGCHHFVDDINRLHAGRHLAWDTLSFHVHKFDGKPHCLVVAREPCALPKLDDYMSLPSAMKKRF